MVTIVTPPPGKPATCRECGAGLTYMPGDVQRGTSTDYGGGKEHYKYIQCPACASKVIVR